MTIDRRTFFTATAATGLSVMARPTSLRATIARPDPAALVADLPLLKRAYDLLHPGLYRYQTPQAFAARIDDLARALETPASLQDQYIALSSLTAAVRCGHTYANFFNQSKSVSQALFEQPDHLPVFFVWVGSRMVVTANPLGLDGLSRGSEILAVNDVPVAAIQARLMSYVRADGHNDAKRRKLLDVQGGDAIETFDVLFSLFYPQTGDGFRLQVRATPGTAPREIRVEAIDRATRLKLSPQPADIATPGYWRLAFHKRTAILTMPGWALYRSTWDWKARLDAIFADIAAHAATGLVIDLRNNEGGLDCGYDIISRLIDAPLPIATEYDRRVRFRAIPDDLRPCLDTWDRSFDRLGECAEDLGNGFYRLTPDADDQVDIMPKGPRFHGKVIVLSSAQNSSATFQFIDLVSRARLAKIYGEPTGGNQRGINGGAFFFLRLPKSGLEADLPLIGTFPKTPKPDTGLSPDIAITPQVEDIAAGRDRVLERALADLA